MLELLASSWIPEMQAWLEGAYYPVLLGVFVIASLGVPIPEDVPLIAAGVLLASENPPGTWTGTLIVSLIGIMSGDTILYTIGRIWGRSVLRQRLVRKVVSPRLLRNAMKQFEKNGVWFCFFGRFFVGIRAAMCMSAGITRFPFWRFFLADLTGAVLSIPFFIGLGYLFANALPKLHAYLGWAKLGLIAAMILATAAVVLWLWRRHKRLQAARVRTRSLRVREQASVA